MRPPPRSTLFPYTPLFRSVPPTDANAPDKRPSGSGILAAGATNVVISPPRGTDRKSTRLNSSHLGISYAVFCLKKKTKYATLSSDYTSCNFAQRHKHDTET